MRLYIIPSIGKHKVENLQPRHARDVEAYVTGELGLSPTTALAAHATLSKLLTDAKREGITTKNVAQLTARPVKALSTRGALSVDEAKRILTSVASDTDLALNWAIALLLGLRQAERIGLTRESIDLESGRMTVSWQLQRRAKEHGCGEGNPCGQEKAFRCPQWTVHIPRDHEAIQIRGNLYLMRPKSDAGWRRFRLPDFMIEMFRRYFAENNFAPTDLIFTNDGAAWDNKADYNRWQKTLVDAEVRKITLHEARHSTATILDALEVPDNVRIEIMGHADAETTKIYTHVHEDATYAALNKIAAAIIPPELAT